MVRDVDGAGAACPINRGSEEEVSGTILITIDVSKRGWLAGFCQVWNRAQIIIYAFVLLRDTNAWSWNRCWLSSAQS